MFTEVYDFCCDTSDLSLTPGLYNILKYIFPFLEVFMPH